MKRSIFCILILSSLFACNHKKENTPIYNIETENKYEISQEDSIITMNQLGTNYDTLINRIRKKGDREAYMELFYHLMESTREEQTDSVMALSKIMAQKYHYETAYFDYFTALCKKQNIEVYYEDYMSIDISKMDKTLKKMAEDWLQQMIKNKIITKQQYDSIRK